MRSLSRILAVLHALPQYKPARRFVIIAIVVMSPTFAATGCVGDTLTDDAVYEFHLLFERDREATAAHLEYIVFSEQRTLDCDVEFCHSSTLMKADMRSEASNDLRVVVPRMWCAGAAAPGIPLSTRYQEPEFRLTVFCPGFAATTVYPMGTYNRPPKAGKVTGEWDSPSIMWCEPMGTSFGSRRDSSPVGKVTFRGVEILADIPVSRLTTRYSTVPDAGSLEVPPGGVRAPDGRAGKGSKKAFAVQVVSLAEAIRKGQLDNVASEARDVVRRAIRLQAELDGGKWERLDASWGEKMHDGLKTIDKWGQ